MPSGPRAGAWPKTWPRLRRAPSQAALLAQAAAAKASTNEAWPTMEGAYPSVTFLVRVSLMRKTTKQISSGSMRVAEEERRSVRSFMGQISCPTSRP